MRTFDEIEEKDARLSVQTDTPVGSGVLFLDRAQTRLSLSTKTFYHPKTDINGWFDLQLSQGRRKILLHNALLLGQTNYGRDIEFQETQIFPNSVIFNADALDKSGKVREVIFRFEKFGDFFVHRLIEHQFLSDAPKDVFKALKKLRNNKYSKQYPIKYDFHKPESVYLVHFPSRIVSFVENGNRYEIGWGMMSRGMGGERIELHAEPIASIKFSKPKTLDQATDEIWRWKRLFCQLAMENLDLTTISARGTQKRSYAEIYLSNSKRGEGKKKHDGWSFARGDAPFAMWKERKKLGFAMKAWLSKDDLRHTFRVNVDRVLKNLQKAVSLEDVVTLCSAIESLSELKGTATVADADLKKIVAAAIKGAKQENIAIPPERITGVLALLKHQSLPQRLKLLFKALEPLVTPEHAKIIIKGTLELRTIAAHGGATASLSIPRVRPIVTALAGACAFYDLRKSEFPILANEQRRIMAVRQINEAMNWLAHLDGQKPAA